MVIRNSYELGIFSSADKIRTALLGVFIVLGNVFYPRVQSLLCIDREKGGRLISNIILYQSLICFLLVFVFYLAAPYIVRFYLGEQYGDAVVLLKIMAPMIFLIPTSIVFSNYMLLPFGYKKYFSSIPMVTSVLHLSYVIIFSRTYGSLGAAISILITESISFLLLFFANLKLGIFSFIYFKK